MTNTELIDKYLTGSMTEAEQAAFEKQLATDAELNREFNFNKDVVSSIQEARKAELKAMLNTIPVGGSTGTTFSTTMKVAGALTIAAITIGAFYFLTKDDAQQKVEEVKTENIIPAEEQSNEPVAVQEETLAEKPEEKVSSEQPKISEPVSEEPQQTQPAEIKTPNLIDDFENESGDRDITAPEANIESESLVTETLFDSNIEVVTDNSKKKYQFHYQMKNEKLYLYGSFDQDLYEILEFNNTEGKTIFLYYKEKYYFINPAQSEIKALTPIEDQDLIKKLNSLRK